MNGHGPVQESLLKSLRISSSGFKNYTYETVCRSAVILNNIFAFFFCYRQFLTPGSPALTKHPMVFIQIRGCGGAVPFDQN